MAEHREIVAAAREEGRREGREEAAILTLECADLWADLERDAQVARDVSSAIQGALDCRARTPEREGTDGA